MSRSAEDRAQDILEAISRCERYLVLAEEGPGSADLVEMAEDAIERNLQIIGKAANHLPVDVVEAHPEVPWPQIRGFRNILVHQYFGVDIEIIRDLVVNHLPVLGEALRNAKRYGTGRRAERDDR